MLLVQAWDNQGTAPDGWGSHILVYWRDFEPDAGVYRIDQFLRMIERRDRPCYVQLIFSLYGKATTAPQDYTPAQHKRSLKLVLGGLTGEIPPYDSAWTEAYCRAVEALALGLRDHPQVIGYWHAAGWNAETQAACLTRTGDWTAAVRPLLRPQYYYNFIKTSTARAVAAWGDVPVYLPGAPSPGGVWGTKNREIVADCLKMGAGYMNCGLQADNSTSIGLGMRAGLGMYDIGRLAKRRGFEEGQRQSLAEPLELYWLLMRARHWQGDFVNLYGGISVPQVEKVEYLLPADDVRWIVFRNAEYGANVYTSGGKIYGHSGEPGPWGSGITVQDVTPVREGPGFGFDRWVLETSDALVLTLPDMADGEHVVTIWRPDGSRERNTELVQGGQLTLPPGRYHRVDVAAAGTLTLEERVRSLERRVASLEGRG